MHKNNSYSVAIIGGGTIGTALSYFLSKSVKPTILIESKTIGGSGATSTSGGILRCYDNDILLRELTYKGCDYFFNWDNMGLPGPTPVKNTGTAYIFRGGLAPMLAEFIDNYNLSKYLTLDKLSNHDAIGDLARYSEDDICLSDRLGGYASPRATATQLAYGAVDQGCTLLENTPVESISYTGGLYKIRLAYGYIYSEDVVLCPGSFFSSLLDTSELRVRSIPLLHIHSQGAHIPMPILDDRNSTYIRPIDRHNFYCGSQSTRFALHPDNIPWDEASIINDALVRLDNLLNPAHPRHHIGLIKGFDCYTPNHLPLIGAVDPYPGLYIAMGFSGLGFKYSLSAGESLAAKIAQNRTGATYASNFSVDLSPFTPPAGTIKLRSS